MGAPRRARYTENENKKIAEGVFFSMLRQMKTGTIIMSIGYLLIGLLLLTQPASFLQWICLAFGVVILLTGIVNVVRYFRISGTGFRAPFLLTGGVVAIAVGLFLLISPKTVVSILPVVFGLFILLDGCIRIGNSVELAKAHGQKWWLLLLLGLFSVLLGILLIFHPFDALVGVVMLSGILLVVEGALNLGCIIYASMEMRTLSRLADAALQAAGAAASGDAESAARVLADAQAQDKVVYDADATEVNSGDAPVSGGSDPAAGAAPDSTVPAADTPDEPRA